MMKILFTVLATISLWACAQEVEVPVSSQLPLADPFILCHGDQYYAYGTGEPGFRVYVSRDLRNWEKRGIALDLNQSWGTKQFWAPEVYYSPERQRFYLFYSAEEHICVATSDHPAGPFRQAEQRPIREEKGIDASLFVDDDGTPYLYFVRFTDGNVIWAAQMDDTLTSIREETLTECVKALEPWERDMGKVAEGPSVLKEGGRYYLLYSANDYRSPNYGVGYATAPTPLGPWTKYPGNPILQKGLPSAGALTGVGHGAPFRALDGQRMYVFHAHHADTLIHPRMSYIQTSLSLEKDGTMHMTGAVLAPVISAQ